MVRRSTRVLRTRFTLPRTLDPIGVPSPLVAAWWEERTLACIRWYAVPLVLLVIPLFPSIPAIFVLLLATVFGLGNVVVMRSLSQPGQATVLPTTRRISTGLDWVGGTMAIALLSEEPAAATPGVLLLLLVGAGLRYRRHGVVVGTAVATIILLCLITVQVQLHGVLEERRALAVLASWLVLLALAAVVIDHLTEAATRLRRWEHQQAADERVALVSSYQRVGAGLSKREWELLSLLERDDLSYDEIARRLAISRNTVKTHLRRMSEKFGVHGRQALVAAAHERGLLAGPAPRADIGDND